MKIIKKFKKKFNKKLEEFTVDNTSIVDKIISGIDNVDIANLKFDKKKFDNDLFKKAVKNKFRKK